MTVCLSDLIVHTHTPLSHHISTQQQQQQQQQQQEVEEEREERDE